jgi:hypothetical protein
LVKPFCYCFLWGQLAANRGDVFRGGAAAAAENLCAGGVAIGND